MDRGVPGRVLVVDDQQDICWVLAKLLTERNHLVKTAQTGAAALSLTATFEFDVAIVDYRLPDRDGLTLIVELTRRLPGVLSILMSSYGTAALRDNVHSGRVFAFLDKPFSNMTFVRIAEDAIVSRRQGVGSRTRETAPGSALPIEKKPFG